MGEHDIVVLHREVDSVAGALDYRASCESYGGSARTPPAMTAAFIAGMRTA